MRNWFGRIFGALAIALACLLPIAHASAQAQAKALAIDEGQFVAINGVEQWVTVRGSDPDNPVILMLHGGPGFPMSFLTPLFAEWEKDFTIVQWDQPATGGTFLKNQGRDIGPLTIERYVTDGLAVAQWARTRLGKDKIVLLGSSWGSLLGLEMIRKRPELFSAYVGTSQPVGPKGAVVGYEMALSAARARNDSDGVAALERIGPPPYERFEDFMVRQVYSNAPGLPSTPQEAEAGAAMVQVMMNPEPAARYNAPLTPPPGYDGGLMAAQQATWRETWAWDAAPLGTRFEVPILIVQGEVDINTPTAVAREWFDTIDAPSKSFEVVPGAGHGVILFHAPLLDLLEKHVLPIVHGEP